MGVVVRGAKNAFRNPIRTLAVVVILGLSIGLSLVMLLAERAVTDRIAAVQASIGNIVTITPAGSQGFEGGGEPLTGTQLAAVGALPHVVSVHETLLDRLTAGTDTSLASSIDPGTLGNRRADRGFGGPTGGVGIQRGGEQGGGTFTIPIQVTGVSDPATQVSDTATIVAGSLFAPDSSDNVAVVGQALAEKNSLEIGSTFQAYGKDITVTAIVDLGNEFANSNLLMPLTTLQTLSDQADQVSAATVQVDSITNLDSTVEAIKTQLGSGAADVVSNQDTSKQALEPLENIRSVSTTSLIGALVAGAVITLLVMVMIVRERRKEIGTLKAIGASDGAVMAQFVTESLVLSLLGSVVGMVAGVAAANPILRALVSNSASSPQPMMRMGGGFATGFRGAVGGQLEAIGATVRDIHAVIPPILLLYGLGAAVLIALIGSAFPAWLIARVRPAEVMRGE